MQSGDGCQETWGGCHGWPSVETPSGQQYIYNFFLQGLRSNNLFTEWVLLPANSPLFENVFLSCVG